MSVLSQERIAQIDAALQAANGDIRTAAQSLGLKESKEIDTFRASVYNNETLWRKWTREEMSKSTPLVSEVETIGRNDKLTELLAAGIRRENMKLRQGLQGLNLSEKEMELAMELNKFHDGCFKEGISIISSGSIRLGMKLQIGFDEDCEELRAVRQMILDCPTSNTDRLELLIQRERSLMDSRVNISRETRMAAMSAFEGAKICAYIKAKNSPNGGDMKKAKPAFSPIVLEMNAAPPKIPIPTPARFDAETFDRPVEPRNIPDIPEDEPLSEDDLETGPPVGQEVAT